MTPRRGQWSLRTLLIATAALPMATYALLKASAIIASVVLMLGCLGLIAAVIVWLTEKGERQAIARGVAVAALVYGFAFWYTDQTEPYQRRSLVTARLLDIAYENCMTQTQVPARSGTGTRKVVSPDAFAFKVVGQVYWCAIVGLAGGYFARWVYRRRMAKESTSLASTTVEHHDSP